MSPIHYLTVQDLLWINHRVTGKVNEFRYDLLEEATFYQYAYGQSTDLAAQAQRFFEGFPKKSPFSEGNEQTAVVGALAFLRANGMEGDVAGGQLTVKNGAHVHGQPDVRAIIEGVIADLGGSLQPAAAA